VTQVTCQRAGVRGLLALRSNKAASAEPIELTIVPVDADTENICRQGASALRADARASH
jgi:hypothetical protein